MTDYKEVEGLQSKEVSRALVHGHPPSECCGDFREPILAQSELDNLPLMEMGPMVVMRDPFDPDIERLYPNPFANQIERIGSFKEYLLGHFYAGYVDYLKSKISNGSVPVGKHSRLVPAPERVFAESADVLRVDFFQKSIGEVYVDLIMIAKIRLVGAEQGLRISDEVQQWYRMRMSCCLESDDLSFNEIHSIRIYDPSESRPGRTLDEHLIPVSSAELLEDDCEKLLNTYYEESLRRPMRIEGETLAQRMGLRVEYHRLTPDGAIRGQVFFEPCQIEVWDNGKGPESCCVSANTVVIDKATCLSEDGSLNQEKLEDALFHECFHAHNHRLFYLGQRLYNSDLRCLSSSVAGEQSGKLIDPSFWSGTSILLAEDYGSSYRTPIHWAEWQADRAAPRIKMPARTTERKIEELISEYKCQYPDITEPKLLSLVICELSDFYGASRTSAKCRMVELGYEAAKGVMNFANGKSVAPYAFSADRIGKNQTFTIDLNTAAELYRTNEAFRKRLASGKYQYIDGHYCLIEPRYVYRRNGTLHLTSYARAHMDECCLAFTMQSGAADYLYHEGTLQKEVVSSRARATYEETQNRAIDFVAEANRISAILDSLPGSPCTTLTTLMKQRNMTVERLIAKSGVSSRTINFLRTKREYKPTLETAVAISIGLHLEPAIRRDWMQKLSVPLGSGPKDLLYEMLLDSFYMLPLSGFNEKLKECGLPTINEGMEELDS